MEENVVRSHMTTSRPILVEQQHDGNLSTDENRVLQEGLFCLVFLLYPSSLQSLRSKKLKDGKEDSVVRPMTTQSLV